MLIAAATLFEWRGRLARCARGLPLAIATGGWQGILLGAGGLALASPHPFAWRQSPRRADPFRQLAAAPAPAFPAHPRCGSSSADALARLLPNRVARPARQTQSRTAPRAAPVQCRSRHPARAPAAAGGSLRYATGRQALRWKVCRSSISHANYLLDTAPTKTLLVSTAK